MSMKQDLSCIVVNATALDRSGALSILRQFIDNIPENNVDWLVFIPYNVDIDNKKRNVRLQHIKGVKSLFNRFLWDVYGLNKWLRRNGVVPIAIISLQNTGFRVSQKGIPHFIYYHQSLPFFSFTWNPFKRSERALWFYKHIYPFFVKLFLNKETKIFVQLDFIKKGFARRFGHNENMIEVYTPSVASVPAVANLPFQFDADSVNIFFPASGLFYKNHKVVFDALKSIRRPTKFYVTIPSIEPNVISTGVMPFESVCAMYRNCDALVYPSFIETFGLPLIEAAMTGMPIIAADLPYAREVLAGYEGAVFVDYTNPDAWTNAIENIEKGKRFQPIDISGRPGWEKLFTSVLNSLK